MDIKTEKVWLDQTLLDDKLSDGSKLAIITKVFYNLIVRIENEEAEK